MAKRLSLLLIFTLLFSASGCGLLADRATKTPIYVTATAIALAPTLSDTPADTPVFGPTSALTITWTPLPTGTKTPVPPLRPTLTQSFTPEFTDTPAPTFAPQSLQKCSGTMQPNGFTTLFQRDKALQAALGCPQSSPVAISSATLAFDNGTMLWASALADQPRKVIYALFNNGTYQRYDDTWIENVDPATTGDNPPAGRKAPIRGFGKVWHNNPTARSGLGWALGDEAGTSAQIQRFERGELIYVASTNQTYILAGGTWRADPTKF